LLQEIDISNIEADLRSLQWNKDLKKMRGGIKHLKNQAAKSEKAGETIPPDVKKIIQFLQGNQDVMENLKILMDEANSEARAKQQQQEDAEMPTPQTPQHPPPTPRTPAGPPNIKNYMVFANKPCCNNCY
jgi:hypothetical protein